MTDRITRHLEVRGQVQGVGYRYSMVGEARRLGVNGWVRNRRGGNVEAIVQGPQDAVDAIIRWARRGPAAAEVQNVEVQDATGEFSGFETRPTE
jgi:acylphosphatase